MSSNHTRELFEVSMNYFKEREWDLTDDQRGTLYGLAKQATSGDCTTDAPLRTTDVARMKWEAWSALRGLSREEAMRRYMDQMRLLDSTFDPERELNKQGNNENKSSSSGTPHLTSSASDMVDNIHQEGILYKQRDVLKGWRPRYFILDGPLLSYYINRDDDLPKNSLLLSSCSITSIAPMRVADTTYFPFVVSHNKSSLTYNLAARSEEERRQWEDNMKRAARIKVATARSTPSNREEGGGALLQRRADGPDDTASSSKESESKQEHPSSMPSTDMERYNFKLSPKLAAQCQEAVEVLYRLAMSDDDWEEAFTKNDVHAYRKPGTFICVKGRTTMNYHITAPFAVIMDIDRRQEFDAQFNHGHRVRTLNDFTMVDYLAYNGVWPTSPRDFVNLVHWRLHEGSIVVAAFSHTDKNQPEVEGHVRADVIIAGWVLRPTGPSSCEVTYIVQSDLKGSIPKSVVNLAAENQPMLVKSVKRLLEADQSAQKGSSRLLLPQRTNVNLNDCLEVWHQTSNKKKAQEDPAAVRMLDREEHEEDGLEEKKGEDTSELQKKKDKEQKKKDREAKREAKAKGGVASGVSLHHLLTLFLPLLLYTYARSSPLRGPLFLLGVFLSLRYLMEMHLGDPRRKFSSQSASTSPEGRLVVKFPIPLMRVFPFLEEKRKSTGVNLSISHLLMKAVGIALKEHPNLCGQVILGGFYPSTEPSIAITHHTDNGEAVLVKMNGCEDKSVEMIGHELSFRSKRVRNEEDANYQRKLAFMTALPPFLAQLLERTLDFLGSQLGFSLPAMGVQPFPFGNCTIITAPIPNGDDRDIDLTFIPTSFNASTPITIATGGIRIQPIPSPDDANTLRPNPVLNISASFDCRAGSYREAREFCERVQLLVKDPRIIEKYDRKKEWPEEAKKQRGRDGNR